MINNLSDLDALATRKVFFDKPLRESTGKRKRLTYASLGDHIRWVEYREWSIAVPDKETGELRDQPSSGALINMEDLDDLINGLIKIRDHHNKVTKKAS